MIRVIKKFKDKNTGHLMQIGDVISDASIEREEEIISLGYAEKIKEKKEITASEKAYKVLYEKQGYKPLNKKKKKKEEVTLFKEENKKDNIPEVE